MSSVILPKDLRNLPLLAGLTEQEKEELLKGGFVRRCSKGQMLFLHGDPVTHFYIVLSGIFQLFRETPEGKEKTLHLFITGQTMCEDEILGGYKNHRASAVAVDDASVMEFPVAWLKEKARKYNIFALNLLSYIADQAHEMEIEAEHRASLSASQQVACFLQRLCVLYEFNPKGFELPYSKTLIASRLGMKLETFSRTLAKLCENGITVTGSRVEIRDLPQIARFVCSACSVAESCSTHKAMEELIRQAGIAQKDKVG